MQLSGSSLGLSASVHITMWRGCQTGACSTTRSEADSASHRCHMGMQAQFCQFFQCFKRSLKSRFLLLSLDFYFYIHIRNVGSKFKDRETMSVCFTCIPRQIVTDLKLLISTFLSFFLFIFLGYYSLLINLLTHFCNTFTHIFSYTPFSGFFT